MGGTGGREETYLCIRGINIYQALMHQTPLCARLCSRYWGNMNKADRVSPLTHVHSHWEKHRKNKSWWQVHARIKIGNESLLGGSWVVREILPEVVTFNLRFSDKKKAGSYRAQGSLWWESNRERGSCSGKGTRVHEPGSHGWWRVWTGWWWVWKGKGLGFYHKCKERPEALSLKRTRYVLFSKALFGILQRVDYRGAEE